MRSKKRTIEQSLQEYGRGVVGGLLFSLPMIYTMEVWWIGFSVSPLQLILLLFITFALLMGYNRFAGMHENATWAEVAIDSVEEMGIGLLVSFLVLLTLGRISLTDFQVHETMGKVVLEAMTVAIGVSVGTAQLGTKEENEERNSGMQAREDKNPGLLHKSVLALCGSIIVAGNIAPTEEIIMIAYEIDYFRALLIVIESLLLAAIVLYFIDFAGTTGNGAKHTFFKVSLDTCVSYLVALFASALMLWFFGRFNDSGFDTNLLSSIVLAFPGVLGASAGRLLLT